MRLKGRTGESLEFYIASAEFPGDAATDTTPPCTPREVVELVQHCQKTRSLLLLGCNVNAHHTKWNAFKEELICRFREFPRKYGTIDELEV